MELTQDRIDLLTTHLPYELDQLDAAYIFAGHPAVGREGKLRRLVAIDCFYLHARSLIEFYSRRPAECDSRTAAAWEFTHTPLDYPSDGSEYASLINDQVAHLNYARGIHSKEPLSGTAMITIQQVLRSSLHQFQRNLTPQAEKYWTYRKPRELPVTEGIQQSACNDIYVSVSGYLGEWVEKDGDFIYVVP